MSSHALTVALHFVHVAMASFWLGSLIMTDGFLWPAMEALGIKPQVQKGLLSTSLSKTMQVVVPGVILTGYARGAADGVFEHLYSPHGVLFLIAAAFGTLSAVWWLCGAARAGSGRMLWKISLGILFALMMGLRFTA